MDPKAFVVCRDLGKICEQDPETGMSKGGLDVPLFTASQVSPLTCLDGPLFRVKQVPPLSFSLLMVTF